MTFATALDSDSLLHVLSFLERDSLEAVQLTCRYLCDFVEGITSLPLRQLDCIRIEGNDGSTGYNRKPRSLTVERNGERQELVADSMCVAVRHFFIYVRNSYCGKIEISHMDLSLEFVDRFVAMRNSFKTRSFVTSSARLVDVSPADLQRLIISMCPGLSHLSCGWNNTTPAHVTDQLLEILASKGVNKASFSSTDPEVYFDVSDEAIVRFCSGPSEAKELTLINARVTQPLFDGLVKAHCDFNNHVDLDLILNDPKMQKIDFAGHTERIEDEHETTYTFASDGWTMEVRVDKHGYFSVCRFKAGNHHSCRCPTYVPAIPTKKGRIV